MNYEDYNNQRQINIFSNGPISNFIGGVISIISTIIGLVMIIFFAAANINDYSIKKNYIKTTAIITQKQSTATYIVKYNINGKEYTNELLDAKEYNINDTINIYYKPNDYNYITYEPQQFSLFSFIPIIIGLILFISGINGIRKHFHNVMHYIKPNEYDLINTQNTTGISIGNEKEDNKNYKKIKF